MSIENKKIFNTRVQLKYSTWNEWQAKEDSFIPLKGEICIVAVPQDQKPSVSIDEKTQTPPAILFKVGDGVSTLKQLPWASGLAADVAEWAKKTKGSAADIYTANNVSVADFLAALEASQVAYTKKSRVEGEADTNIDVKTALDSLYDAIATLSGDSGESIADLLTKVNNAQATANSAATAAANAQTTADSAVTAAATAQETANSAATAAAEADRKAVAANENANTRVLKSDFTTYTQTTDGAIQAINNTIAALGDTYATDTELSTAIAGVNATIAALGDTYATDDELATAIAGVNATIAALGDTYATDDELKTVKEGLEAVIAALDNTYATDAELKEVKEGLEGAIADINGLAATHVTKDEFAAEQAARIAAENKALQNAKDYTDEVKAALLGDNLTETFDTLKAVQDWVDEHGEKATELTSALATETAERKAADAKEVTDRDAAIAAAITTEVSNRDAAIATAVGAETTAREAAIAAEVAARNTAIADAVSAEATARGTAITNAIDAEVAARNTAIADAISAEVTARDAAIASAKTDLEGKITAAEAAAKKHADDEIAKIKLNTLEQDDYVIFYCGDANTFIDNAPVENPEEVPAE